MSDFAEAVRSSLKSVVFVTEDLTAGAVAAYAVASASGRSLMWLEIRDPHGQADPFTPMLEPLIPAARHSVTHSPNELAPGEGVSSLPTQRLIRADEPKTEISKLTDFLRLPERVQELTAELTPSGGEAVLLVTGADRLAELYPEDRAAIRLNVLAISRQSVKLVTMRGGRARDDRFAYDFVFRIRRNGPDWGESLVECEQGDVPPGTAGAALTRLSEIDSVQRVIQAMRGPSPRSG